jgi:hypothetical protein
MTGLPPEFSALQEARMLVALKDIAALLRKQSSFLFGANASGSGTDQFTQPGMCSLVR